MEKPTLITLIVSAFCFSSLLSLAHGSFSFIGKIYCDPCRIEFETELSQPLSGVKVGVVCTKEGRVTYSGEGLTDSTGMYNIPVEGEHEGETCELKTVKNTHLECNDGMIRRSDKDVVAKMSGVPSTTRYLNALGFMTRTVDPRCADVVRDHDLQIDIN